MGLLLLIFNVTYLTHTEQPAATNNGNGTHDNQSVEDGTTAAPTRHRVAYTEEATRCTDTVRLMAGAATSHRKRYSAGLPTGCRRLF
jgi:hypothetical protein